MKIVISVCSRTENKGRCLFGLQYYASQCPNTQVRIAWDQESWYKGHSSNAQILADDDIIVMAHDDLEILSANLDFYNILNSVCSREDTGFVGLAGCTHLGKDGVWWNARQIGATRGFVFQGKDKTTMSPNYFGTHGQVICLDGCLLACSAKTLKKISLEKSDYLSSGWDFYDIDLTFRAHQMGLNNYTIPLICRHESNGEMRPEWHAARQQFTRYHANNLPTYLNHKETNKLPITI